MTEEVLVKQMKEGDKASFDLLYEKYRNMALHTAYLITGSRSLSEDIVQDTFVKVYLHCRELKNDSGFKAWMMQILVRTAYKGGKKANREIPDEEAVQKADTGDVSSSLEQVLAKERAKTVMEAVRSLPLRQRSVVILYYYQEYRIPEIAKIIGCREGTVKSRLHTAKRQLRRMLEETVQTGQRTCCADRAKEQQMEASGLHSVSVVAKQAPLALSNPSRSDLGWPDAVTEKTSELLLLEDESGAGLLDYSDGRESGYETGV